MCIIASLEPESTITEKEFENMWDSNPDGGGIVTVGKNKLFRSFKSLDKEEFFKAVMVELNNHPEDPHVIHFRLGNIGSVSKDNCHPFKVNKRLWLAHNGTISGPGIDSKHKLGHSDTRQFASLLGTLQHNFLESDGAIALIAGFLGVSNKMVFLEDTGETFIYGKNHTSAISEKRRWFSNSSYKDLRVKGSGTYKNPYNSNQMMYPGNPSGYHNTSSNSKWLCNICKNDVLNTNWDSVYSVCIYCSIAIDNYALDNSCSTEEAKKKWKDFLNSVEEAKRKPLWMSLSNDELKILEENRPNHISKEEWEKTIFSDVPILGEPKSEEDVWCEAFGVLC